MVQRRHKGKDFVHFHLTSFLSYMAKPPRKTPSKIRTYISSWEKRVVCGRQWAWGEASAQRMSAHPSPALEITGVAPCASVSTWASVSPFSSQGPPRFFVCSEPPAMGSAGVWEPGLKGRGGSCQREALPQGSAEITAAKAELGSHHLRMKQQQQPESESDNIWGRLCCRSRARKLPVQKILCESIHG